MRSLEKALTINPNNQQAKQALTKLAKVEAKPSPLSPLTKPSSKKEPVARPSISKLENSSRPTETVVSLTSTSDVSRPDLLEANVDTSTPEFWINKEGKLVYITALFEKKLVSGIINPGTIKKFQAELQQGNFPMDMLTNNKVIPFNQITEVSQTMSSVKVHYTKSNSSKSTSLESKNEETAEAIIGALQKRLGSKFERTATPMGRGKITAMSSLAMAIFLGITTFCYFAAVDVATSSYTTMGSARVRGWKALLGVLGPNGVACIGGVLFLLILVVIVFYLVNPPLVTKLVPNKEVIARSTKR